MKNWSFVFVVGVFYLFCFDAIGWFITTRDVFVALGSLLLPLEAVISAAFVAKDEKILRTGEAKQKKKMKKSHKHFAVSVIFSTVVMSVAFIILMAACSIIWRLNPESSYVIYAVLTVAALGAGVLIFCHYLQKKKEYITTVRGIKYDKGNRRRYHSAA